MTGVSFNVTISPVQQHEPQQRLREDCTILGDIRGGAVILVLCSIFSDSRMTHVKADRRFPFKGVLILGSFRQKRQKHI